MSPALSSPLTSACPRPHSGPAGDSSDTSGSAYAHPGAPPDRHVHAGEVSQAVGTEGMLGGEP